MIKGVSIGAREYILDLYEAQDRVALLTLHRSARETIQRITSAAKAATPEFQAWLRYKNATGSDIYMGMNPLRHDASTRTKEDIASIRHIYLDLDYEGPKALERIRASNLIPKANFELTSSPDRFQVVWRVEGIALDQSEALLHALAQEFGGDPAATDATRVLRLPGFANKKYTTEFYVEALKYSLERHHLRDFKLPIDGRGGLGQQARPRERNASRQTPLSQSEHDWAYAKRALARGDSPERVIQQIADYRSDKNDPEYYARLTVRKALKEIETQRMSIASKVEGKTHDF